MEGQDSESQIPLVPPNNGPGMVSLTPLTHLLCWEGWLHPSRGQRGILGLPSFSCGAEGRTQSGLGPRSSCHVYQRYLQCFYPPTPEQGHMAKMSPLERCKRPFWSLSMPAPGRE